MRATLPTTPKMQKGCFDDPDNVFRFAPNTCTTVPPEVDPFDGLIDKIVPVCSNVKKSPAIQSAPLTVTDTIILPGKCGGDWQAIASPFLAMYPRTFRIPNLHPSEADAGKALPKISTVVFPLSGPLLGEMCDTIGWSK